VAIVVVVASAVGGVEELRTGLVEPAVRRGWQVGVTLTPSADRWLRADGELPLLASATGLPVRSAPRFPWEESPHPDPDCFAVLASANLVAKLALGIADTQASTQVSEAIGGGRVPVVLLPRTNADHAAHPAFPGHLATLRSAGVRVLDLAPAPPPPWADFLAAIDVALG
jgi:Flavoprotein